MSTIEVPEPLTLASVYTHMDLEKIMLEEIEHIKLNKGDVNGWFDTIRNARQPQNWTIDYIEHPTSMENINNIIRESEVILYGDNRNLSLKDGYKADIYQEIAFHTIRAHLRAEEGDIKLCLCIFDKLYDEWYDLLSLVRKTNLLMHICLAYLCDMQFSKSYECYQKHWILLKYYDEHERTQNGLWDNHIILTMIYWFFMKHNTDFRDFYIVKTQLQYAFELWNHKKVALLHLISSDHSWVVSFCSLALYNHARNKMPSLPEYQIKAYTPINDSARFSLQDRTCPDAQIMSTTSTISQYYYDEFNKETLKSEYYTDWDMADNFLYSYYCPNYDWSAEYNYQHTLFDLFVSRYSKDYKEHSNILVAGGGEKPFIPDNAKVTVVDISELVCHSLTKKGITNFNQSITTYIHNTRDVYDIVLAYNILQCLTLQNV